MYQAHTLYLTYWIKAIKKRDQKLIKRMEKPRKLTKDNARYVIIGSKLPENNLENGCDYMLKGGLSSYFSDKNRLLAKRTRTVCTRLPVSIASKSAAFIVCGFKAGRAEKLDFKFGKSSLSRSSMYGVAHTCCSTF
jgi:hypothetical protein